MTRAYNRKVGLVMPITITHDGVDFGRAQSPTYLVGTVRADKCEFNESSMHAGFAFSMLVMAAGADDKGMFGAVFIVGDHEDSTFMECKRRLVAEVPNSGTSELGPVYVSALPPFDTLNNNERAARVQKELQHMSERFRRTADQLK